MATLIERQAARRPWNEEERLILEQVARLSEEVVAPRAAGYDASGAFPWENVEAMNALGLNALFVPEAYGGAPVSYRTYLECVMLVSAACASSGIVYATSNAGRTAAIDLRRGSRLWERDLGGPLTIWAGGDYLFLITNKSELVALQRDNGAVIWVTPLPQYEDPDERDEPIAWVGPILASDRLIVAGSHGEAYTLSPYSGKFLGTFDLPAGAAVSPIVVQEYLIFLSTDADLVVMH